ncbi:hypothetical protein C8J57DRAFT_1326562 [Mycena rebaudengoi]|nr:hypothetical protein C8J57DRAFT_1326562 [Mycena rebaudengoi]
MGKNTPQKIVSTADWGDQQLQALCIPFPEDLDPHFRHSSDLPDDFMPAYRRAAAFIDKLGDNRVAYLWQQALKIGFRAGRTDTIDTTADSSVSEDFALGREVGLKEGRTGGLRDGKQDGRKAGKIQGLKESELIGFEKGKLEGLGEGKRMGFVTGREFGEKQAIKLSKTVAPLRVLVDVGTDSPVYAESPPALPPCVPAAVVSTPTDALRITAVPSTMPSPPLSWTDFRIYAPGPPVHPLPASRKLSTPPTSTQLPLAATERPPSSAPFRWEDEPNSTPLTSATNAPRLPARDFSVLRSDTTSLTPFGTLQYRSRRTQRSSRAPRRSTTHAVFPRVHAPSTAAWPTTTAGFASRRLTSAYTLDWDRDPRLSELGHALRSMGWTR